MGHHGQRGAVARLPDLDAPVERPAHVEQDGVLVRRMSHGGLLGHRSRMRVGRMMRRIQRRDQQAAALRLFGGKR
ncbi:hypothetical protein Acsp06_61980 [Actinomycetospora sp. NBRC 106375]|nr:hypothetical protein Acsp06_61980 [Actinomycetospora sp. NBRC 106375]